MKKKPFAAAKSDDFIAAAERAFARVARKLRAENHALEAKIRNPLKVPFGTAKWSCLRNVSFHQWEDAFEVEFDDGLSFLEPHRTIRRANKVAADAVARSVELEPETRGGFFVHYDNGQTAEISWSFIRELPPTKSSAAGTEANGESRRRRASPRGERAELMGISFVKPCRKRELRPRTSAACADLTSAR